MAIRVNGQIVKNQTKIKEAKIALTDSNPDWWLNKSVWFLDGLNLYHGVVERVQSPQDVWVKAINQSKKENPEGKSTHLSVQISKLRLE